LSYIYSLFCSGYLEISVNGAGAVWDQKILVFVLQMEKSKKTMWMG
jgi:hypothetical protein